VRRTGGGGELGRDGLWLWKVDDRSREREGGLSSHGSTADSCHVSSCPNKDNGTDDDINYSKSSTFIIHVNY
jgi:hypothetical protein